MENLRAMTIKPRKTKGNTRMPKPKQRTRKTPVTQEIQETPVTATPKPRMSITPKPRTRKIQTQVQTPVTPRPQTRPKDIAFLFLTYDDILHDKTKEFIENQPVYVNAKNPVKMNYIVKNYPTKWGAKSIVDATIKLLELAYQNGHEWFVLLAYDVYPLVSFGEFKNFMKYQTKSMFNVIKQHENEWKASQWWILCRRDVETILSRHAEYDDYLTKIKYTITGAWDELYFLSLLKYVSPTYSFLEYKTVYTEWMQNSQQSHPVTYNKILPFDLEKMKGSFFLRKTTPTFTMEPFLLRERLVIKIYGDQTRNYVPEEDVILVSMVDVPEDLKAKCLYIYHSHHSSVYINVLEILERVPVYLWKEVVVLTETCNTVPVFNKSELERCALPRMPLSSPKQFYALDNAFLYSPYKIAFLFLTIGDINQPNVWTEYFKNNHKVSIYTHAKVPDKIVTPWLKDSVIPTQVDTAWGRITNAYYHLFQEAMKDEDNIKFVTISESCIPLKRFDLFYEKMLEDVRTSYVRFMEPSRYDIEERIETQVGYEMYAPFIKHYARMCLSRYHVTKLLEKSFDFFNEMHVGDEFFLTLLHLKPGVDFVKDFEITYDNWEEHEKYKKLTAEINKLKEQQKKDNSFLIEDKIRIKKALRKEASNNPRTYVTIGIKELDEALNKESFFWRKFPAGPLPWTNEILTLDKKTQIQPIIAKRRAENKRH